MISRERGINPIQPTPHFEGVSPVGNQRPLPFHEAVLSTHTATGVQVVKDPNTNSSVLEYVVDTHQQIPARHTVVERMGPETAEGLVVFEDSSKTYKSNIRRIRQALDVAYWSAMNQAADFMIRLEDIDTNVGSTWDLSVAGRKAFYEKRFGIVSEDK